MPAGFLQPEYELSLAWHLTTNVLHDVLDMNFDGSFRNDEFLRDATSAAVGDLLEDLNLAAGVRASSS